MQLLPCLLLTGCAVGSQEKLEYRFEGRVLDIADATPLKGAAITVVAGTNEKDPGSVRMEDGKTDAEGRYRITIVEPFEEIIWILPPLGSFDQDVKLAQARLRVQVEDRIVFDGLRDVSCRRIDEYNVECDFGDVKVNVQR